MFLTRALWSGRITHWPSNSRGVKNRRHKRLLRVQSVEAFLRPYRLNAWNRTKWYAEQEEATASTTTRVAHDE